LIGLATRLGWRYRVENFFGSLISTRLHLTIFIPNSKNKMHVPIPKSQRYYSQCSSLNFWAILLGRLFEIHRTEMAENHKDRQYCQVCRSRCPTIFFVLHRKSEMQLVCRNDHGQLGIRFCFKWHLLLKHATVSMVILLIIVFL
jgi:hypothetical protein